MTWTTNPTFVAYDPLPAASMAILVSNLEYLNTKINQQIQLFSWEPRLTSGSVPGSFETSTNKVNLPTQDFADSGALYAQCKLELPSDYAGGTLTARFLWACANATTNSAVWQLRARAFADGDALDQAFGTAVAVLDANNANLDYNISAASSALTIAGTPAAGELAIFEVFRDPAHASDNLGQTARLIGVVLSYTRL